MLKTVLRLKRAVIPHRFQLSEPRFVCPSSFLSQPVYAQAATRLRQEECVVYAESFAELQEC